MVVDDVVTRLGGLAALAGRVEGAAELSAMVAQGSLPQQSPFAYVLPLGLRPLDDGEAAVNAFTQGVDEVVGVVLVVRSPGDATGRRALASIDAIVAAAVEAICGWAPNDGAIGVFRLQRGALISLAKGTVFYQLDFAIQNQVRVIA
jgi:hypothetical protein